MLNERIRRARVLKGLSLQEVADELGDITKQALSKYEKGKDTPNSTRLIRLAEVFGVEPEYFFRSDTVDLGSVDFRKHSSLRKKEENAIKEKVREQLERYLAIEACFPQERLGSQFCQWQNKYKASNRDEAEVAANILRDDWKLGTNPISNLTEVLEDHDIKVISFAAHEKFDGLCALVNGGEDAVIVSNSERPGDRQRFNLAHELGHLVMDIPDELEDTKEEEYLCHRFASAFLFPGEQVISTFGGSRSRLVLNELILAKKEWGLSIQAIVRRLVDLGVISHSYYTGFCRMMNARGIARKEPGVVATETAYRMEHLAYHALAEDLVTPSRAAELLQVSLSDVESLLANQYSEGKDADKNTGF
ncbi:MAG: XRE family transcriptional regulator [Alcanivorax sp.]|nr:XRE family transcriptional regulator [Alcanivorax sp.]